MITPTPYSREPLYTVDSIMAVSPDGEWVRWSDVKKLRKELEDQIPEKRIEKLERKLRDVYVGKCPECGELAMARLQETTRDYKRPQGTIRQLCTRSICNIRRDGPRP